jgi:hypothetical protein
MVISYSTNVMEDVISTNVMEDVRDQDFAPDSVVIPKHKKRKGETSEP